MFTQETPPENPEPFRPVTPETAGLDMANAEDLQLYIDGQADESKISYLKFRRLYEQAVASHVITPSEDQQAELLGNLDDRIEQRGQEILDWRMHQEPPS